MIAEEASRHGRSVTDIACEILSTMPYPLGRVIARHGLGRFRVTQKADLDREDDVYRGENARPEDWIMLGNHDTRPIWLVAEEWLATGASRRQAEYLASRLVALALVALIRTQFMKFSPSVGQSNALRQFLTQAWELPNK